MAVLKMAAKLFNERGFAATSLDDIASGLDVTKATVYHYFSTKEEMLFQCAWTGVSQTFDIVRVAFENEGSGADRWREMLRGYAHLVLTDFGQCVLKTSSFELTEVHWRKLSEFKNPIKDMFRKVLEEGIADGSLRQQSTLSLYALAGAINWIPEWFRTDHSLSADAVIDEIIDSVMRGVLAGEKPKRAGKKIRR